MLVGIVRLSSLFFVIKNLYLCTIQKISIELNMTKNQRKTSPLYISKVMLLVTTTMIFFACKKEYIRDFDPQINFDALWETIDSKYCFFEEKRIDWDNVRVKYNAQIGNIKTELDMFDLFARMLDTLQDGHINLYSQFDVSRCVGWFEDYPANFDNNLIFSSRYLGKNYRRGGAFLYNTIANGKVGYIRYSDFTNSISYSSLNYIEKYFRNCKGIIIDVRNNGGGSLLYSQNLASIFMDKNRLTGYTRHKTGSGHSDFSELQAVYTNKNEYIDWSKKKVVVLTNRMCYSATNDFVCRIKNAPNVTVIGGKTGGGGGIPSSNELPCGWLVRFSAVQMLDKDKKQIEFGIEPDIAVDMQPSDVADGYDTLIDEATLFILQ